MLRLLAVFIVLFIRSTFLVAQSQPDSCEYRLDGTLRGSEGQTVSNTLVYLMEKNRATHTSAKGVFSFSGLCKGTYTLQFFYEDYHLRNLSVNVPSPKPIVVSIDSLQTDLEDVEIHSERKIVPMPIHQLSRQLYNQIAGRKLGDVLTEIPGVQSIQTGVGVFKPVIHGLNGQRVLILNQGVRQEGQNWGLDHAPEIDPFSGLHMEVLKDANALRYGPDVMGGAILIQALPLLFGEKTKLGGSVLVNGQSNGRMGVFSAMLEGGIRQKWAWRAQSTLKKAGDFHTPNYLLTNTGTREFAISTQVGRHADTWGTEIWFSSFRTTIGLLKGISIGNLDDLENAMLRIPPLYTSSFSYKVEAPRQEVAHYFLKWNFHKDMRAGKLSLQYAFQQDEREEYDLRIGKLVQRPVLNLRLRTHTLDALYERRITENLLAALGSNSMLQTNENVPGTFRIPFIPNYDEWHSGLYATLRYNKRRYTWNVAGRYDMRNIDAVGFNYRNDLYKQNFVFHHGSASAGVQYNGKKSFFSFNLLYTWRPPHVAELFSLGLHQSVAAVEYGLLLNENTNEIMNIRDSNYKNEQAIKTSLSWQYTRPRWTLSADAYANVIYKYIYLKPEGITQNVRGVFPYFRQRQTDALFYGLDATLQYQFYSSLTAISNLTLLQSHDLNSSGALTYIPSNKIDVSLRWEKRHNRHQYTAEVKGRYRFKQYQAPRVIALEIWKSAIDRGENPLENNAATFDFMSAPPGYFLGEVYLTYAIRTNHGKYEIQFSCRNLLNSTYREYTDRLRYYAEAQGRDIGILLKYSF